MAGSEYYEKYYEELHQDKLTSEELAELTAEDFATRGQPNYMYGNLDEQYDPRYANIESLGLNPQDDSDVELYNKMQLAIQEHQTSKNLELDPNVQSVITKYKDRARAGFEKYGTNTTRTDIDLQGWLTHLQEELMDATIYIERLKKDIK
jgi:hypothetical protein